jgi:2-oxoglutarate ferredoxin oxidoreductase subunit alpha
MPVIVLLDKNLSNQYSTVDAIKMDGLTIDRVPRFKADGRSNGGAGPDYLRFGFTETGVTPRAIPGDEGGIFWSTSDEHDPRGHITEDAENRIRMMDKRMGKLDLAE